MANPLSITDPVDLALDTNNDLMLAPNGDLMFVAGIDAVAQGCRIAVQMFAGEWFANTGVGIRYLPNDTITPSQALLGQKFNAVKARAEFRRELAAVQGVAEITSLNVTFDPKARKLSVTWSVRTVFGNSLDDAFEQTGLS